MERSRGDLEPYINAFETSADVKKQIAIELQKYKNSVAPPPIDPAEPSYTAELDEQIARDLSSPPPQMEG